MSPEERTVNAVYFRQIEGNDPDNPYGEARLFMSGFASHRTAEIVAYNLVEENFVAQAWVEAE